MLQTCGRSNCNAEPKQEPTTHELADACGETGEPLDDSAQDHEGSANDHPFLSTKTINDRSNKWQSDHASDLVDGRYYSLPDTQVCAMKVCKKDLVLGERIEEEAIIAIHGRAEEAHNTCEV